MTKGRTLATVLLALLICLPLSASVTNGVRGLKTASTEHFDIIYQEQSKETAALLYENCEDIYASLVEFFGSDPKLHLPVTVTSEYKTLNAYYTIYPANRIVMFDTVSEDGSLSVFPETILYIFRHELTHAFQFNYRGPVSNVLSKVFGDIISLSPILYMYPSLSEGGAVLSESVTGYGRINDSYSMQIVKQAKMEGLFPQWIDVAGARTTYPGGLLYYNFAACFLQFLADNYGLENVATLWVNMGRPGFIQTLGDMFTERVGKPAHLAWQEFYDSIEVPEHLEAEAATGIDRGPYSNPVYSSDGKLYYIHGSTSTVELIGEDLETSKTVLFAPSNESNLSVSEDGTMFLVPIIGEGRSQVRLYKGSKLLRTFEQLDEKDPENKWRYRSGCFVTFQGREYALLSSNLGQRNALTLVDLETGEPVEGKTVSLGYDALPSSLTTLDEGRVAFILRHKALDQLAVLDIESMEVRTLENPDRIRIMSLSKGTDGEDEVLSFVWYPDDARSLNLGRYGEIKVSSITEKSCEMTLSKTDVSGSMRDNIRINDRIIFSSYYYETRNLSSIKVDQLEMEEKTVRSFSEFDESMAPGIDTTRLSEASRKYHSIKYFKDGLLVPAASVSFTDQFSISGLGVQWLTLDPTETFQHVLSLGYGSGSVIGSYTLDWTSSLLSQIRLSGAHSVNDKLKEPAMAKGTTILEGGVTASLLHLEIGNPNTILSMADSYDCTFMYRPASADDAGVKSISHSNVLSLLFSTARSTGSGLYETFAFEALAELRNLDPSLTLTVSLPRLLWWRCTGKTVTNLPSAFRFSAAYEVSGNSLKLQEIANVYLFSREIQRGVRVLSLYLQRFYLKAAYTAEQDINLSDMGVGFGQKLAVSGNMDFNPVFGGYLTHMVLNLNVTFEMDFTGWKPYVEPNFIGITISFGLKHD